jgi:putative transposase
MPHHVTQRGNRGIAVFRDERDRQVYLSMLGRYASRRGLDIWAYCLMDNHIHLIAVPHTRESLALALRDAHTAYAAWANRQQGATGHLWQGRFFSCVMDETHLWAAVRYIERNPVRASLIERAQDYQWSSAAAHCGLRQDPLISPELPAYGVVRDWGAWLADEDEAVSMEIRRQTHTGRPCGSQSFIERIETLLGRSVRPKRRGRKKNFGPMDTPGQMQARSQASNP